MTDPLLEVRNLRKYFFERDSFLDRLLGDDPVAVKAVDGLNFEIERGETLGLVGESGCGKSTAGETVLRLQEATEGKVYFDGSNVYEMDTTELQEFRRRAAIVFQDPFSSLDPRMTIGETVKQPLDVHDWPPGDDHDGSKRERRTERVRDLLNRVGLSGDQFDRYPHEFSGGQRQRIGIARALALNPDFVVLDEPTSALDVSVQAQILNLLDDLQSEFGLTYLLVSHDLSVIRHICDRVAVMYLGEIVEVGPSRSLFSDPQHPYTKALLESVPRVDVGERERDVDTLSGEVPSPRNPPTGCRFRTRCPSVIPPEDVDIEQDEFRTVQTVRDRIRNRDVDLSGTKEFLETDETDDLADRIVDTMLDLEEAALSEPHRSRVREALSVALEDEWEEAEKSLAAYESVCEDVTPALQERQDHRAACHLLDQPAGVEDTVTDSGFTPRQGDD